MMARLPADKLQRIRNLLATWLKKNERQEERDTVPRGPVAACY